jgi:hypothetical protein
MTNDDTTTEQAPVEVKALTQNEEDLIGQMQIIIQFFLDLLQFTGGDLAPDKSTWFLIERESAPPNCARFSQGNTDYIAFNMGCAWSES